MRIANTILVLAGLLAAGLAGSAQAARLPVKAKLSACGTGADLTRRAFDTDAYMARIKSTRQMGIRFDLQTRRPAARRYHTVERSAGFGRYYRSKRGVGAYRYARTTNGLAPLPAAFYRMRVSFRWYGKGGKVLRTAHRDTGPCFQPEGADLVVRRPRVTPRNATTDFYSFRVANRGHVTVTTPFDVTISLADGASRTRTVSKTLGPGQSAFERFVGPTCSATAPTSVLLDAGEAIDESHEANNRFTFACP